MIQGDIQSQDEIQHQLTHSGGSRRAVGYSGIAGIANMVVNTQAIVQHQLSAFAEKARISAVHKNNSMILPPDLSRKPNLLPPWQNPVFIGNRISTGNLGILPQLF